MSNNSPKHFKGKDAIGHVIEARIKGKIVSGESHGLEVPGHIGQGIYALKETSALLLLFWIALISMRIPFSQINFLFLFFFFGWIVWNVGRSAFLGWWRLQRLNKLISEERWEIEHHRSQEKQELEALYKAKGFTGKLLQEVVEVLMADDNRLLQVMLEEEMGIVLSSFEHPLKHALSSAIGVLLSFIGIGFSMFFFPSYGILVASPLMIFLSILFVAKKEKTEILSSTIWALGILGLSSAFIYFMAQILKIFFL